MSGTVITPPNRVLLPEHEVVVSLPQANEYEYAMVIAYMAAHRRYWWYQDILVLSDAMMAFNTVVVP